MLGLPQRQPAFTGSDDDTLGRAATLMGRNSHDETLAMVMKVAGILCDVGSFFDANPVYIQSQQVEKTNLHGLSELANPNIQEENNCMN